ncbi:hypothetical protein [Nonomuraea lactucae]|nr:hypothetical protein [Nonomuraea lactucae]
MRACANDHDGYVKGRDEMRQTQIRPRPRKPVGQSLDLRTPSGRKLPF